jgi:hypothetical protein
MIETGFTLGAIKKQMIGLTHAISKQRTIGLNLEYCNLKKIIQSNFSIKSILPNNASLTNSFTTNHQAVSENFGSISIDDIILRNQYSQSFIPNESKERNFLLSSCSHLKIYNSI